MGIRGSSMENMEMKDLIQFGDIYREKTVLITGHTGFKGSWLTLWLKKLGAKVIGYSLEPPTKPNHFELIKPDIISIKGDVRDRALLNEVFSKYKPDIVFHLAAQSLVRYSYENPLETYEVNVIGTLNIFDMCRKYDVKAIVNVTSDKCYENKEWVYGYREVDPMGGYDPYSSSKGCAELLTSSYRNSFFNVNDYGVKHNTLLASCRAGNVVGGGDWAKDRLITDIVNATVKGEKVKIRNPEATRPWQFVLEPLSGYLMVGQKLLEGKKEYATAWNFGPTEDGNVKVKDVLKILKKYWEKIEWEIHEDNFFHEAQLLKLDCSKANFYLKWKNVWNSKQTFEKTILWYKNFYENNKILTEQHLSEYIQSAYEKGLTWVK